MNFRKGVGQKLKILVVDDDKEIVQLLEIYVKNEGYEPVAGL